MTSVLVVDDLEVNRQLVQLVLTYRGYWTIEAASGAEAIDVAQRLHPDIVVTDVYMPDVDGYALARQIRADPDTADIPIILYSSAYVGGFDRPPADLEEVCRIVPKNGDVQQLVEAVEVLVGR